MQCDLQTKSKESIQSLCVSISAKQKYLEYEHASRPHAGTIGKTFTIATLGRFDCIGSASVYVSIAKTPRLRQIKTVAVLYWLDFAYQLK